MRVVFNSLTFARKINFKNFKNLPYKPLDSFFKNRFYKKLLSLFFYIQSLNYVFTTDNDKRERKTLLNIYLYKFSKTIKTVQKAPIAHRQWSQEQYKITGLKVFIVLDLNFSLFNNLIYLNTQPLNIKLFSRLYTYLSLNIPFGGLNFINLNKTYFYYKLPYLLSI